MIVCGRTMHGVCVFAYILVLFAFSLIGIGLSYTQTESLMEAVEWKRESLADNCTIVQRKQKNCRGRKPTTGYTYEVTVLRCPHLLHDWSCGDVKQVNETASCYVARDCSSFKWNNTVPYTNVIIIILAVFWTVLIILAIIDLFKKACYEIRTVPEQTYSTSDEESVQDVDESAHLINGGGDCEVKIED
eukprot:TRINITY_DN14294_c0_g1_i1.p1 TRINITY_DN14294_c0_g1~~TRINITY_DN14294_c0_g1_i1.p1  ORF type:complete len:210 (+),score=23.26 TRINITY_DN14294_c0_g1_i1:66-632(+)